MIRATAIVMASWVLSWLIVFVIRMWAEKYALLDWPNERSSHTRPTPRGGGAAIVLVTIAGLLLFRATANGEFTSPEVGVFATTALVIAAVSFVDDVRHLPSAFRLLVHVVCAAAMVGVLSGWTEIELPFGSSSLGWIGGAIMLLWVVGLTNAYNFMDGIDAIAAGQAIVAGLGWALIGGATDLPTVAVIGLLVTGSALGFLVHNRPPARIFMGDVGSAFLGFVFAVLTVIASRIGSRFIAAGVLLVYPFVFDTTFTFLRRLRRGERIMEPHRTHLYQRLHQSGWSHGRVALLYGLLAAIGAAVAFAVATRQPASDAAAVVALIALPAATWAVVIVAERQQKRASGA